MHVGTRSLLMNLLDVLTITLDELGYWTIGTCAAIATKYDYTNTFLPPITDYTFYVFDLYFFQPPGDFARLYMFIFDGVTTAAVISSEKQTQLERSVACRMHRFSIPSCHGCV